jgi:predicted AlkP superfamily phosphohydrolase/phosphomutase
MKARRGRRGRRGSADRVVILGLDGLDPTLTKKFMREGKLPHFAKLEAQGAFTPLATSYPSIWASPA